MFTTSQSPHRIIRQVVNNCLYWPIPTDDDESDRLFFWINDPFMRRYVYVSRYSCEETRQDYYFIEFTREEDVVMVKLMFKI